MPLAITYKAYRPKQMLLILPLSLEESLSWDAAGAGKPSNLFYF